MLFHADLVAPNGIEKIDCFKNNDVCSYVLPGLIPQHQQGMYAGSARVSLHQSAVAHGRPGPSGANRPGQQTVPSTAHRPDR